MIIAGMYCNPPFLLLIEAFAREKTLITAPMHNDKLPKKCRIMAIGSVKMVMMLNSLIRKIQICAGICINFTVSETLSADCGSQFLFIQINIILQANDTKAKHAIIRSIIKILFLNTTSIK